MKLELDSKKIGIFLVILLAIFLPYWLADLFFPYAILVDQVVDNQINYNWNYALKLTGVLPFLVLFIFCGHELGVKNREKSTKKV